MTNISRLTKQQPKASVAVNLTPSLACVEISSERNFLSDSISRCILLSGHH